MNYSSKTIPDFTAELSSSSAVPGGGGASALVAATGISLGNMVGALTSGKKKYADVEDEIRSLMEKGESVRKKCLSLIDEDAKAFAPLAKAYGIPKDDPDRDRVMEEALKTAANTPLLIMRTCAEAIDIIEVFAKKGSRLAVSDAGCGAVFSKAAMQAASLNVFINTAAMKDREYAARINEETASLLNEYTKKADEIFADVENSIRS